MTARPAVLRALTDLFCLRDSPSEEEIARYSELALRILPDAGPSTRLYVAAKLARHASAPREIMERLADSDPACAALLLEHARNFPVDKQIDLALRGERDAAVALAARKRLEAPVAEALVARNDPHVTKALVANESAHVTPAAVAEVTRPGRPDRAYGAQLAARAPRSRAPETFLESTSAGRADIIANARRATLGQNSMRVLRDDDLMGELRECAITRDWDGFSSALARKTGLPGETVRALVQDSGGEPLAILLAIVGASHSDAVSIYLCCDAPIAHSYQRVRELAEITTDTPATAAGALVFAMAGARPRISTYSGPPERVSARHAEGVRASEPAPVPARAPTARTPVVLRRRMT